MVKVKEGIHREHSFLLQTLGLIRLQYEYTKALKKVHTEESGKAFDESILNRVGQEIDIFEAALGNTRKEEAGMNEKEQNSDSSINNNNDSINSNFCIANDTDNNKATLKTKMLNLKDF